MNNRSEKDKPSFAGQPLPASETQNKAVLVRIADMGKRYGKHVVLKQVNLDIRSGESLALWGENGAGKTTLLKAILGLLDFTGQIHVAGEDVARRGKQARARIGYVPQEAVFYDMSVWDTLMFYARLKKVNAQRIPVLLERLGLTPHQYKPVPALSGGLKQRLALAVALLSDPPVLLLDEPTANLDARARKDYLDLLLKLRKDGKTFLFASHRLEEVELLADRVVLLETGAQLYETKPANLRQRVSPQVILTMWVQDDQRQAALALLQDQGWSAHLNGRGTVVTELPAEQKMQVLQSLGDHGILVRDFEVEGANATWN